MDLQALSDMNSTLTAHLNMMQDNYQAKTNYAFKNMKTQNSHDIVLARKGDSGYVQCFDTDNNGEITMDEFNQYCEDNGVSEKEKLQLLSLMGTSKTSSKVLDKTTQSDKEDSKNEKTEGAIYAKKGDDKYNEVMDTDKNNVVTYKEYMDYCNKRAKNTEDNTDKSKAEQAYSQTEHFDEYEEFSVEAIV